MYATRPLSTFKNSLAAAHPPPPPEGPASGFLLLQDEEPEATVSCCWGVCGYRDNRIQQLPFPQNRIVTISYSEQREDRTDTYSSAVLFIPVPGQPASSNRYYVIIAQGNHIGKAFTCSKEEDMSTCCCCHCINDVKPTELDHRNLYQQMEIMCYKGRFTARPVASDGIPPALLRREYWELGQSKRDDFNLAEALGANEALRVLMPEATAGGNVVAGRWYAPFVFVEEDLSLGDQVKHSAYYEITLERIWEEVCACENVHGTEKVAQVKAVVQVEAAYLNGKGAKFFDTNDVDGMVWFKPLKPGGKGVKLGFPVWERMKWEISKGEWRRGGEEEEVERVEEYRGVGGWKRYRCLVLVERFAVRRLDGTSVLEVDFKHSQKVQGIWE